MARKSIYRSEAGERAILALYERVLGAWPVPCERTVVPTRHGDTFAIASGDPAAPALVLLHGSGSNAATWLHDAIAFSAHFRTIALDLPGEPGLSHAQRPPWSDGSLADWLADAFDGLGLVRAALGGISLGGWVALRFALAHPARVDRLFLLAPGGIVPARASFAWRALGWSLLGWRGLSRIQRLVFQDVPLEGEAEAFFALVARHFIHRQGSPPLFSDAQLQSLVPPVLTILGARDVFFDAAAAAARLRKVPGAVVHVLPGAGHAVVNQALRVLPFLRAGVEGPLRLMPEAASA